MTQLKKTSWLIIFFWVISAVFLVRPNLAAPNKTVKVYFFWAKGCRHCAQEEAFLQKLAQKQQDMEIVAFELTGIPEHRDLLTKVGNLLKADIAGVPVTVIGQQYFVGWYDEKTTGRALAEAVREVREKDLPDVVAGLIPPVGQGRETPAPKAVPDKMRVPIFGEIDLRHISLGLLTLIFGALDGFNPCAMWVLVILINLLLGMEDKKKMWIIGGIFILTSGIVYFLFMAAWLNLLVFLGFIFWVRVTVGLIALAAGGYNLKEYLAGGAAVCKVAGDEKRRKIMERMKGVVNRKKFILAVGGIILLAFSVNLIELICSAGLPVVYMQILSLNQLPFWQYYLYMTLYIFIFILDDLMVFVVAMMTLQLIGVTTKYKRLSNLIGGVVMLIIGILLIFKPEALMFG